MILSEKEFERSKSREGEPSKIGDVRNLSPYPLIPDLVKPSS